MRIRFWRAPEARLVITEAHFATLRKHLLQADGLERACFALLGRRMSLYAAEEIAELYVHQLLLPNDHDYADQHTTAVEPRPEFVLDTFTQYVRSGVPGYLHAHSHPFSNDADFSPIDDQYFPGMQQSLRNYLRLINSEREKNLLFIRLVYGQLEEGFRAECVDAGGRLIAQINELRVVGPGGIRTISRACPSGQLRITRHGQDARLLQGLFERNVRFLGEAGQRKILQSHLVICGAGGLGSFVLAQAKGLGFRRITIIDPDRVEQTNLNRLIGATPTDIGQPKVETLAAELRRYDPQIVVRAICAKVQEETARQAIIEGNVIVNCLDNDAARLEVQILTARHLKPLLDLGSGIMLKSNQQSVAEMGGQAVFYIPGEACLICQGLDPTRIVSEPIRAIQRAAGYIAGTEETPASVVTLNAVIAGLGMDLLMKYLTGFARVPTYLRYDLLRHQTLQLNFTKRPDCPICGKSGIEGKGEELAKPLPSCRTQAVPTPRRRTHTPVEDGIPPETHPTRQDKTRQASKIVQLFRSSWALVKRIHRPFRRSMIKGVRSHASSTQQRDPLESSGDRTGIS